MTEGTYGPPRLIAMHRGRVFTAFSYRWAIAEPSGTFRTRGRVEDGLPGSEQATMAIQFFCVACGQPIEVDDDLANQAVTCPYCRKVVTAPSVTDVSIGRQPSEARTASTPNAMPVEYSAAQPTPIPAGTNVFSWVSLACVSATLITLAIFLGFLVSILRGHDPAKMDPEELNKLLQTELMARPGLQLLSMVGSCAVPVVGVICAVIALVKRTPPRWPAIASLCVFGVLLLCICSAFFMQAAQMAGQVAP